MKRASSVKQSFGRVCALLATMVLLNAGCGAKSLGIPAPPVQMDRTLLSVSITVACASVYALSGLPDGWSASISPKAEDYVVTLLPVGTSNASQDLANSDMRLRIAGRGQWSDCLNVSSEVVSEVAGKSFIECYESSGTEWKPGTCR
jgi:hypothetical protein